MIRRWPDNKDLKLSNDNQVSITSEDTISSLQIAALNESTERSTSKPQAIIAGQDSTNGRGTDSAHTLIAEINSRTGPFISQHVDNVSMLTNLYNSNIDKFNDRVINNTLVEGLDTFLYAILGNQLSENIDVSCVYVINASDVLVAGVHTFSEQIPRGKNLFTKKISFTNKWFIPESLFIKILNNYNAELTQMSDFKALSDADQYAIMDDASVLNPYLPTGSSGKLRNLNAYSGFRGDNQSGKRSKRISGDGTTPSQFDLLDDSKWWTTIQEYIDKMVGTNGSVRVNPDSPCINSGLDKNVGWDISTKQKTIHGTPLTVNDDKIQVSSDVLDAENLPADEQFTIDIPWDSSILTNLAGIFADPADYSLLDGQTIKVEVLKSAVSVAAGADTPPSILTYLNNRKEQLDAEGNPVANPYEEESVIPAINRVHRKTNQALASAGVLDQYLTTTVIGNPAASQAGIPGEVLFEALSATGYDATTQFALARLNLIPILSGDRLIEAIPKLDEDSNQVYTDLGIPETVFITQEDRANMSPTERRARGMLHPESDTPPTKMLEALWTTWRHISADTTNTYGVSALTDPKLQPDELIEPLSDHSFIDIFNSLYTDLSGLSADLSTHKFAISGDTDQLIEALSGNSVYTNLNNIYTGLSALSAQDFDVACCDVLQLSALELSAQTTTLSSDLSALSGYVMDLDLTGGGTGGTTELPCDNICEDIDSLKKPIISTEHPGGFDIPFPSLDDDGNPRSYTPDVKIPTDGGPAGVEPGTVVYKTIIDEKEYIIYKKPGGGWVADGPFDENTPTHYDGPGVSIIGGDEHGPAGGTLPDPFPQQPPITERPDPFPEWSDKLVEIREIKERVDDLEECCDDFQRFKRGVGDLADPAAPAGFKIPPIDPTTGDTPTGWGLPPLNPGDPHVPVVPTTGGGIIVPDPTGGGTTTYTPVPPDAADFPPAAKPGTVVYKTITNEGETKYIYKDRTINKWIHTGTPGDPTAPDWTPLDEPPQIEPNPVIPDDTTGGVIADYPTTGTGKPYLPVPDGDPKPTNADPNSPVYKHIDNSTNTTRYIYKDVITNRWIVTNGDPDDPTIQPPANPLDAPDPHVIIKTIHDEFTECCEEFKDFLDKYNENPPPVEYEIPDFTPDDPSGPTTPWYHPVPGANPDDPTDPNPPVIMPVDEPTGAIAVPGPEADDPKVYTPVAPDDPNRPPDDGVKPGTIIYKYITQAGETKYIYKHITTNKWIKGDNPDDPNDPTGTPLGDPPDDTGGVINRRPDGGVDVPYPPIGPAKPYQPIPQDDPGRPTNVCEGSVVYKYTDPATNVDLFVYCDIVTGKWMVGGNPDTPGSPKIPLDPPSGGDTVTTTINSLSALVENNIIQIDSLSGCCTDNKTALSALSAAIYGVGPEPDVFVDDLTGSIIFNMNTLYEMILGGGTGNETDSLQVTINKNNITSLSADVEALSACCDTNSFNINVNNTTLTNRITAIETEIDALDDMFVDRTEHQTISGEKVFEDDFTVSAPADFGDNVTIGVGETIFKACTLTNGMTQIQIPRLPEQGVDDLNDLPIDSLYITDINGAKVLAIKTS